MRNLFNEPHTSSPISLLEKVKAKELTMSHFLLYHILWEKAQWWKTPIRTPLLLTKDVIQQMDCTRQYFYQLLQDLIGLGYIRRIYRKGRKRDRYIIIEFRRNIQ